ncbi:septation protein SpoVG family protein [Hungatella effluvii]|uniref:septation protein SpoVG family protein n=1 Tax=Hungatella effluvii TaxID=1096246 RepID=UPI0022E8A9F9|nr:septation protein SpoVG family protein [Hungatella effluvii]
MPRTNRNTELQTTVEEREQQMQEATTAEESSIGYVLPTEAAQGGDSTLVEEGATSLSGEVSEEDGSIQNQGDVESAQIQNEGAELEDIREQGPLPDLEVRIHEQYFQDDIRATADVQIGDICTIRNVKIKEGDYGLEVVMPRTKLPETGRFKDACYFGSPEAKTQFDAAVMKVYQQVMEPVTNSQNHEPSHEVMAEEDMDYDEMGEGEIHGGMGGLNF